MNQPLRKGLRVLVVDGDADSRGLLTFLFEAHEVEAIAVASLREFLEVMPQVRPDVLISELVLPDGDGYSLMTNVKAFESQYQIQLPAIALTAYVNDGDRIQSLAAGFCKHLPKPLDLRKLIATVACVTEQSQDLSASAC